ncbi:MACPF domain-containing protein, partial [Cucurbita argyrosperma subsp. sororia]
MGFDCGRKLLRAEVLVDLVDRSEALDGGGGGLQHGGAGICTYIHFFLRFFADHRHPLATLLLEAPRCSRRRSLLRFDLTNDFRLKFVKGNGGGGRRLVVVDDVNKRDLVFPDGAVVRGVSQDIRCDKGDRIRFKSDVLQFNQVTSSRKPLVGLRLYLEGKKSNWLALHVQHLTSLPKVMARLMDTSDVSGAQLISKGNWPKTILHLRLPFTHLPNCTIRRTEWAAAHEASRKSTFLMNLSTTFSFTQQAAADQKQVPRALNSGVYGEAPPVPVRSKKLLKYVDTAEVVRGPHDTPGHWLVTAAKLVTEGGKFGLIVKFALLDYG